VALLENLFIVFIAGLITDLATGLGVIPFFFVKEFSKKRLVILWGLASGIMLSASFLGLIPEGLTAAQEYPLYGSEYFAVGLGLFTGILLVIGAQRLIDEVDLDPGTFEEADFKKMVLILGILTVHSFPEGIAIGVSFAELGLGTTGVWLGIPAIAITMTIAISIHNIPEGVAIAIPFKANGVSNWKTVGAAVFSSVPQPIGAVIAYYFVTQAQAVLPIGYGFAAGAMIYLVLTEFVEEAFEEAEELKGSGWREFLLGNAAGLVVMVLLFALI
jgi:ZIP family zinc transporter